MLKIGVIGLSEGNGHPYSWSAIINGDFDQTAMSTCGFDAIPKYLAANRNNLGIDDARVTCVWTQNRQISAHIAKASLIDTVADRLEDMIGRVDAVLLARDDPENHRSMAKPFLDAGIPVFVDKPLAITRGDLDYFAQQVRSGKFLMSCSSLRYAQETMTLRQRLPDLGQIELAVAVCKKDWVKYGVHLLEGLFTVLADVPAVAVKHVSKSNKDIVYIEFATGTVATVHLFHDIAFTMQISLFGTETWQTIEYNNWFAMFRNNLVEFINSVRSGKPALDFQMTQNIISCLIAGKESLESGGKLITLK